MANQDPLYFRVHAHIVEHLGVNLYTTLPRVLIEFLANAYDADASDVKISADLFAIGQARNVLRAEHKLELAKATDKLAVPTLEKRTLPSDHKIVVQDWGHGMSLDDIRNKYLSIGRARREHEARSPGGRPVMGRKGLGKLAAFGVAHQVEVVTKTKGASQATKIILDYDELQKKDRAEAVPIHFELLEADGDLGESGTKITLSRLVFESVASEQETVLKVIGSAFSLVELNDFAIWLNNDVVEPPKRIFSYAFPDPNLDPEKLIEHTFEDGDGNNLTFNYRIRFTAPKHQLDTDERGMRVYAHHRLASMPDLFQIRTGIHGYTNTHYLDGKVIADFIDDQPIDYISTDRTSLRWETPLLAPLRAFLKDQMEEGIKNYQRFKDKNSKEEVEKDPFTKSTIEDSKLPQHRKRTAYRVASAIAASRGDSTADPFYKKVLPILVNGLSQGDILSTIHQLALNGSHDIVKLIAILTRLTAQEFDEFSTVIHGRIEGIDALAKLYNSVNFKAEKNEKNLHELFEKNPWLIDPTFTQFLTSDVSESELNEKLATELEVNSRTPAGYDPSSEEETKPLGANKRPDLVFLISSNSLRRIIIIELKAPNTPLHIDHLTQLEGYMRRAEAWLNSRGGEKGEYKVEGYLIGSRGDPKSKAEKQLGLDYRIIQSAQKASWSVYDIGEILDRTRRAHQEILAVYERAAVRDNQLEPELLGGEAPSDDSGNSPA
jgi:hypothetical protein